MDPTDSVDGPEGRAWWARADRALPGGGVYLTRSARFAGAGVQPGFIASAEGCRVTDVDGRRYLDFLCANGPVLLGYRHPEVEEAARRQAARADAASYFPPALVELAEALVTRFPGMAWAVPAKNGSDVVSLGVRAARAATGRDLVVRFERAYHGFDPEWVPGGGGVPAAHRACTRTVAWDDAEALDRLARDEGDALAAVVMNPLDQNPGMDTRAPSPELLRAVEALRARTGALLVLDDVRHGFRLDPRGSHAALGLAPDLLCLGKGLGNGYAVSALLGTEALRPAAASLVFTASHVFGAVALRAACATLAVYDRDDAFAAITRAGRRLREGLLGAAKAAGQRVRITGPPAMPTLLFEDDPGLARGRRFAREAARRGALFHPSLNGFLSAAHDDAAIDEAVAIAEEAFRATPSAG
ncbi:MAG: aminotransferase class III-fold pyridoxal phosphate-dependent enzyme [Myxococcota bacterium]|nr:aminotransferase class III-fold pyridoxal phosphate-dependent enzyme [Myxococcota bacterium]